MVDEEKVKQLQSSLQTSDGDYSRRLGSHWESATKAVVAKLGDKDWPATGPFPEGKCTRMLEMMCHLHVLFEAAKQIYKKFLPATLQFQPPNGAQPEKFELVDIESEGRPIYQNRALSGDKAFLTWCKKKQGGVWAVHTDKAGSSAGDYFLNSPLPVDLGVWKDASNDSPAPTVSCRPADPIFGEGDLAKKLADIWQRKSGLQDLCDELARILNLSGIGTLRLDDGRTLLQAGEALLTAMCNMAEKIGGTGRFHKPQAASWSGIFESLRSLASLALDKDAIWKHMEQELPGFVQDCEITWVQCMIYMCRALDISDLRLTSASWLLRLCNRVFLRAFQEKKALRVNLVDLERGESGVVEKLDPKMPSSLRCAVISDTHGWDADLRLPQADVLLHCGDVLFEGGSMGPDKQVPPDLKAVLETFCQPRFQRYRWIFLIGGNHDRSLHDLWADHPDTLRLALPPNLVLLQAPADLTPAIEKSCLCKDRGVEAAAKDGAVKILPNLDLCAPGDDRPGWVVAGTGVSLANSTWTANNAFQLVREGKKDTQEQIEASKQIRDKAADAVVKHNPDIVLTHGPPQGHLDYGRGDPCFANLLDKTARAHIFGHVHETYGVELSKENPGRCWINAAMSSPLYVPAIEPIVLDVPVSGRPPKCSPFLVLDGVNVASVTNWEVCLHFQGFLVAAVALCASSNQVFVYFEIKGLVELALATLRSKPFGQTGTPFRSLQQGERVSAAANWTCLFDIIGGGKDIISEDDLEKARQARILPRDSMRLAS